MVAFYILRLVIAIYSTQVFASAECVKLNLESGEIAHGKPITASSTCEAFETYCYLRDKFELECGECNVHNRIESVTTLRASPRYWQSAVFSNGSADERVDITINLKQKYHIHQISVSTAFTPQPSVWVIEASNNEGKEYDALVYLVSYSQQCSNVLGLNNTDISNELCIVQQPVKNGSSEKVSISFDGSNVIADHLRLRYLQIWEPKMLQNVKELSRFYTLKGISVQGNLIDDDHSTPVRTKRQACYCSRYGTTRNICNAANRICPCKTGYSGKRCNKCARGRFNYPSCLPCDCSRQGSITVSSCKRSGGQCRCKPYIIGRKCDQCLRGYYGFPSCKWCGCHLKHTTSQGCDIHGKCLCKENYDGKTCGECKLGYVDFPTCRKLACTCLSAGAQNIECNANGRCDCKEGYTGPKCERCDSGYYGYPDCKECACETKGSLSSQCGLISGDCICKSYIAGRQCDRCESGYFGFPRCRQCVCNPYGTLRNARKGNSICASGLDKFQCQCKANVAGETCDRCKDLYYSFLPSNPLGCKSCSCFKSATVGGLESCDQSSGQCSCKLFMEGTKCYECKRGYHSLKSENIFGCEACKCNSGGALYGNCDKRDGKCQCRENVGGTRCDRLARGSVYYPSLHHISVEIEEGTTAERKPVKYGFDLNMFPSYSWKGYVNFSPKQSTVTVSIQIPRRSRYRILFRCIFEPVGYPTTTEVRFTVSPAKGVPGSTRITSMKVSSTRNQNSERSSLIAVSQKEIVDNFLMYSGKWTVTIDCDNKYMLMDYLVFLPEEYYTGRILTTQRVNPCMVDGRRDEVCDLYSYPEISDEHAVKHEAEHGYFTKEAWGTEDKLGLKYYSNNDVLGKLKGNQLVLMNHEQNRFAVDINIPASAFYIFVVHYISHSEHPEKIDMYVYRELGSIHIVPCTYQFGCRQVVMKPDVMAVKVFDLDEGQTPLNLFTSKEAHLAIDYISAIPYDLWHSDYITPALVCRSLEDECISSNYEQPTKFEQDRPISRSVVNSASSTTTSDKVTLIKFRQFFNRKTENFVIVIQYQQTKNIIVYGDVTITTYRTVLRGVADFKYCPNREFCRVVVKPTTGRGQDFRIRQGTTRIQVRFPVKLIVQVAWVYRIPSTSYSDNVLSFTAIDNSKAWVAQCSLNNYVIDPKDPNYCRNTSFALVTHFNNGALPCRCSYYGSRSRHCNPVHGQCVCRRPNIIGRQCLRCRSGYYGYPDCRRCTCDPRGVESSNCDHRGRCRCKPNFTGINCNRCKPGHFQFPNCEPCACNVHGSLSTFCGSSSGQCQCRRGFDGKKCDKCRVGFFGFPNCQECNCHVSGMKPIAGLMSGCNSSLAIECQCKDNVEGKFCDTCKDFHYNLQFNNPQGCQRCSCSALGTNSQLKNCDKLSGQCSCKSRVNGHSCSVCKDGSTNLRDYSIFGCQGCECNYGGSFDNLCHKKNGACSCKRNVGGTKCDRVRTDGFYVKNLHHIRAEFEDGNQSTGLEAPLTIRHDNTEFPNFSGSGYVPMLAAQNSIDLIVVIPRPGNYRLLIRYVLNSDVTKRGQVTIAPKQADPLPHEFKDLLVQSLQFKPTSTQSNTYAEFYTVNENGKESEFFLSRGTWRVNVVGASSKLLLDYLVMIPEDYYKATHLRQRVEQPCLVDSKSEFCVEYKFLTMMSETINVPANLGQLVSSSRTLMPYAPFKTFIVLDPSSQLYLPSPIQKFGLYVLMVTYYQEAKTVSELVVSVTSGFSNQVARIRTFYCKYTFGCRQIAIDNLHKVKPFEFFPNSRNDLTIINNARTTAIALESVTFVPQEKWNIEYIVPSEYCVKSKTGCVHSTYHIHSKAIKVEAEKNGQGMRPSLAMDHAVRAAYLVGDGVSLRVKNRIARGRYKILVHYYQPSHGKYHGRIIVQSDRSTALYLKFKHCPNVGGCRALARDKITNMARSLYVYDEISLTISISPNNEVWIDYILFVPSRHFDASMEKQQPINLAPKFIKECGKNNFIIDSSSEFCKQSVFTMTTMFNGALSACDCDRKGSTSAVCEKFGGQCPCKQNVVGRKCDKCTGGYTGFPNCRRR